MTSATSWGIGTRLFLSHNVISENADIADLDFDDVAWEHVTVRSLGPHPV